LPAYQDYTVRAKMSEVVLAGSACRTTITEVSQTGAATEPAGNDFGCEASAPSQYVKLVATTPDGVVQVTAQNISNDVNDKIVELRPYSDAGATKEMTAADFVEGANLPIKAWRCGPEDVALIKYLPASCRNTVSD
jgi:type IV pilus assembly protein PilA